MLRKYASSAFIAGVAFSRLAVAQAPPVGAPQPIGFELPSWDPEAPAPAGWRRVDGVNGPMVFRAVGVLGAGWLTSLAIAAAANDPPWIPLTVPVAGPFIALGTLDANLAGTSALVLDGVVQSVGLLGIVAGLADRRAKLVRSDPWAATPTDGGQQSGVENAMKIGGVVATTLGVLAVVAGAVTWQASSHDTAAGTPKNDGQKAAHIMLAAGAPTLAGGLSLVVMTFGGLD